MDVVWWSHFPEQEWTIMWTLAALEIRSDERSELERRVRAHSTPQRMVPRCWVILMAAEGVANRRIAPEVGLSENQVGIWRHWFESQRLAGLEDRRRSGRPRVYGHDERIKIVATATSVRPECDSQCSHRLLAEYLSDLGISAGGADPGRVGYQAALAR
jgi:hypothetical protein